VQVFLFTYFTVKNGGKAVVRMEAYKDFATVYSEIMQDTPYDTWEKFLIRTMKKHGIKDGLVLDLGCGTGEMTRRLKNRGYDMIGVDVSAEMLGIAAGKDSEGILYLNQDMREFELYGTVRAIVSVCDSMNYLTDPEDFVQTLKLANNYLDPKGIFIFDLKTVHFYRDVAGESVFGENLDDCSYLWENYYDKESGINEYALTLFLKEGNAYKKSEEVHYQRAYGIPEIRKMVKQSGLKLLEIIDADDYGEVKRNSERIYVIAQEVGKTPAKKSGKNQRKS
jgi:ubiquinone/menaquinone biosynthesis C-methylase UbiE